MTIRHRPVPVIHVVTDDGILGSPDFTARAADVLQALGPRGALHVRGHGTSARRLLALTAALVAHTKRAGCWIVVNDRIDIALTVGAQGVQLGTRSMAVTDVRHLAAEIGARRGQAASPDRRDDSTSQAKPSPLAVGMSVHTSGDPRANGADWILAGHVFETPTHASQEPRGLPFIREVAASTPIPVIAIGGIRPEHVPAVIAAGAVGVAAIRGIWGASDPAAAARHYLSEYDRHVQR